MTKKKTKTNLRKTPVRTAKREMTWKDAIAIAKKLPGVEVSTWYGTPGLKIGGRGFARLRTEAEGGLVLFCSLEDKARLLGSGDLTYFTTPHYDGHGSVIVDLSRISRKALQELIVSASRIRSATKPARAKPKTSEASARICFHCKQEIPAGTPHDCWTTTERALTKDLSDDLQDAWERLRETAAAFGEQRIYASHHSIMFARKSCYFFVRPKTKYLEVCIFLSRALKSPKVRKAASSSRTKTYNIIRIVHRDEVEAPFTDWLREAWELEDHPAAKKRPTRTTR